MDRNLKLSKSITFATIVLTLINVAAFFYFGMLQGRWLESGVVCALFQIFVVAGIAFPNFYYLKIRNHLSANISQTHATRIQHQRLHNQALERMRFDLMQASTANESSLAASRKASGRQLSDYSATLSSRLDRIEQQALSDVVIALENIGCELDKASETNNRLGKLASTLEEQFNAAVDSVKNDRKMLLEQLRTIQSATFDTIAVSQEANAKILELISSEANQITDIARAVEANAVELKTRIPNKIEHSYERLDALISLHQVIDIRKPLPIMRNWTISSDYAAELVKTILDSNGGTVIDVGSGVSTIVMGYAAKKRGDTKVISLDHSEEYCEKTRRLIAEHELQKFCEVLFCPLKEISINSDSWLWYDTHQLKPVKTILISVDGPPGSTQKLARYPAIPMLYDFIDKETTVFLDDAKRPDEAEIASRWQTEFGLAGSMEESHKGFFKFKLMK